MTDKQPTEQRPTEKQPNPMKSFLTYAAAFEVAYESDDWSVVVWDRGSLQFEVLECGLTDFLAGLATGKVAPKEFPDDLLPCDELFQPNSRWPTPD